MVVGCGKVMRSPLSSSTLLLMHYPGSLTGLPVRATIPWWYLILCHWGVSHLQYTDDTIIMENNDLCLANLKFILLCFEALPGPTINFAKSEVIVARVSSDEERQVANLLNCSLGSFPFVYLGLPISPFTLCSKDFAPSLRLVIESSPSAGTTILRLWSLCSLWSPWGYWLYSFSLWHGFPFLVLHSLCT